MPPGRRVMVVVGLALGCGRELPAGWLYITRVTHDAATVVWTGGEAPLARRGPGPHFSPPAGPPPPRGGGGEMPPARGRPALPGSSPPLFPAAIRLVHATGL